MDYFNALRQRIINLAVEKKLSINAVATRAGLSSSTLNSFLNGQSQNPKFSTISLICIGLDVSLSEFFDDDLFKDLILD